MKSFYTAWAGGFSAVLFAAMLVANVDETWAEPLAGEDLYAFRQQSTWLYRDNHNGYRKRVAERWLRVPLKKFFPEGDKLAAELSDTPVEISEVSVLSGTQDEARKFSGRKQYKKELVGTELEDLYFLRTARGVLRSAVMGDNGSEFFGNAFLSLPHELKNGFAWTTLAGGTRLDMKLAGPKNITVPAGEFSGCWEVAYQYGLSETVFGSVTYCPTVGEVKIQEGQFYLELVEFKPGPASEEIVDVLSPEATQAVWPLLPQEQAVAPRFSDKLAANQPLETAHAQSPAHWAMWAAAALMLTVSVVAGFWLWKRRPTKA